MQAEFRAPRKRTRIYEDYEGPVPVSRNTEDRNHFRAELTNQHVLVCDPEHARKIHNQGYFGKGILSRSRPDHSVSDQWEQHKGLFLPVVSRSRYEKLLGWAEAVISTQGLDQEAVSQTLSRLTQSLEVEDVRREVEGAEEECADGGDCVLTKPWSEAEPEVEAESRAEPEVEAESRVEPRVEAEPEAGSGAEPEPKRCRRSDPQDPDHDHSPETSSDQDSEFSSDSDPAPLVPGPGFVLVVPESEEGGGVREVRRSPICLSEYLQLSLEEAFFLVYGLGCLSVYLQQEPLSIIQLWRKFRSLHPDFISSYAAYHHFRSKGWVPKGGGGAKYGVDLMLYRKGPPFYHASYSVAVQRVDDAFGGSALRPFSWRSLAALSRITANVSKELMLCYIIYPSDLAEAELDSPACLNKLKVQEVMVSRWVSSRERAEQDDI